MNLSPSYETTCFPDTGASNHMTADDSAFTNVQESHGSDQVRVGNGGTLPIWGTGKMKLSTSFSTFSLKDI